MALNDNVDFNGVSNEEILARTRMTKPIPDRRGPLSYDPSFTPSLNGVIPESLEADDESE